VTITHVFFDIGGVLGTNGWDREQRAAAVRHFGLDVAELEDLHGETVAMLEQGRMGLDEYLRCTVFYRPRPFQPADFKAFMLAQSAPFPETIGLARSLAATGRYRLMTINNESAELNQYRLEQFGLRDIFTTFFSSCWVGVLKPARRIYEVALGMSQADPAGSVFIDDREQNLEPARVLGIHTIRFTDALQLGQELAELGVVPEEEVIRCSSA
jgi:putative hydrolase of the HAD superfamily